MSRKTVRKHPGQITPEGSSKPAAEGHKSAHNRTPVESVGKPNTAEKSVGGVNTTPAARGSLAMVGADAQIQKNAATASSKGKGKKLSQKNVSAGVPSPSVASSAKPEISSVATLSPISQARSSQSQAATAHISPNSEQAPTSGVCSLSVTTERTGIQINQNVVASQKSNISGSQPTEPAKHAQSQTANDVVVSPGRRASICKNYIHGKCSRGYRCRRRHVEVGGSECRDFKLNFCPRGLVCPLAHIPLQEKCRNFQHGHCSRGTGCNRLHTQLEDVLLDVRIAPLDPAEVTIIVTSRDVLSGTELQGNLLTAANTPQPSPAMPVERSVSIEPIIAAPSEPPLSSQPLSGSSAQTDPGLVRTYSSDSTQSQDTLASIEQEEPCFSFMRDRCRLGLHCGRRHPPRSEWHKYLGRSNEWCDMFIQGRCHLGENCVYRHPVEVDKDANTQYRDPALASMKTPEHNIPAVDVSSGETSSLPRASVFSFNVATRVVHSSGMSATDNKGAHGQRDSRSENTPVRQVHNISRTQVVPPTAAEIGIGSAGLSLPPRLAPPTLASEGQSPDICLDYIRGTCRRERCKFIHGAICKEAQPPVSNENNLDRLVNMLEKSVNNLRNAPRPPPRLTVGGPRISTPPPEQPVQHAMPTVPPGLGLDNDLGAHTVVQPQPATMSLKVIDSGIVTLGPGFSVHEIITGFESKTIVLKNIPAKVTEKMIHAAISPFGEVKNIQMPETRSNSDSITVKASFYKTQDATTAADVLDKARLFGVNVSVRLASAQSTSLGKGSVQDGSIYIAFPAPCKSAYIGFASYQAAMKAVDMADDAEMREMVLSASLHSGVPAIGPFNVKIRGLPANAEAKELDLFGPNMGIVLDRPNYVDYKRAMMILEKKLEEHGELISVKVLGPPFMNQSIHAWAHFDSPVAADAACRALNGRRQYFLSNEVLYATHVLSVIYRLPSSIFGVLSGPIVRLRNCVSTATHRCDIVIYSKLVSETVPARVKLVADNMDTLLRLKNSFEALLRGHVVYVDMESKLPAWDHYFSRPAGISWLRALEAINPGVIIQADTRRCLVRLFGPSYKLQIIRRDIRWKVRELRTQQQHSFPIRNGLVASLFVNADLIKLQRELGTENVYIDSNGQTLKVRGNKDAVVSAHLILQQARRLPPAARGRRDRECPVCLDQVSLPVTLDCGHTWCKQCLTNYLTAAIDTQAFPLNCLGNDAHCGHPLSLKVARSILTAADFYRLGHASFLAYVHARPSEFHYCPTPDCPQVYRTAAPDTVLQCPSCLVRICANCHVEHHEGSRCPDRETEEERLFQEWAGKHDVKRCPGCNVPIERDAGCNHMTCTRCNTHICWVCLETFPRGGAVYDHMRAAHGGIGLVE